MKFHNIEDLSNAKMLLDELYDVVRIEESHLSGGEKLGLRTQVIDDLRKTKINFGNPRNNLICLTESMFDEINLDLNPIHRQQMNDGFAFGS